MKKDNYCKPTANLVRFDISDIVAASNCYFTRVEDWNENGVEAGCSYQMTDDKTYWIN